MNEIIEKEIVKEERINEYKQLFRIIKGDIKSTRYRILENTNIELINLYFRIGKIIDNNWKYGNDFVNQLSIELKIEFPDMKGFSSRNLRRMRIFYNEYKDIQNWPLMVANLPWTHNYILIEKVKDINKRLWYAGKCYKNGWSKEVLIHQIDTNLYQRQKENPKLTNFDNSLGDKALLAKEMIKDPYIFDLANIENKIKERNIEKAMVEKIKNVLLELGNGFTFVGSEYKISTTNVDYYIDLLFYHLELRCFIIIELKNTSFKPEYIGQLNFYITAVNKTLKKESDNNTIGLLLCREKDRLSVEWSLEGINNPIGVTSYEIEKYIPKNILEKLPTEKEINLHLDLDN